MSFRFASAAFAALSMMVAATGSAQAQDAPDYPEPRSTPSAPRFVVTPIETLDDAYGLWVGWIDLYTRVVMSVDHTGLVKFYGPRDVTTVGTIKNDRLLVKSPATDLDCGIIDDDYLTCHARFGTWYAELNLRKKS